MNPLIPKVLLLGLCLISLKLSAAPLFSEQQRDLAAANQQAVTQGQGLAVAFELTDCPQCQQMREQVYEQPAAQAAYQAHYLTRQVRLDDPGLVVTPEGLSLSAADWAKRLGIYGTPAFAFFDEQGQLLARHQGLLSREDLIRLADYVQQEDYERQPFRLSATLPVADSQGHPAHH